MKNRVMKRVLQARQTAVAEAEQKAHSKMMQAFSVPEIAKLHTDYTALLYDDYKHGGNGATQPIIQAELAYFNSLSAHGFDKNLFKSDHKCPKCNDCGVANGKICSCIWDEYINELKKECEIDTKAQFSFDDCRLKNLKNAIHKQELENLYEAMERYTNKYPEIKNFNITLSGSTGTGKSCLASAMARNMVKRGMSVKYVSAYEFNSTMLSIHISPIANRNSMISDFLTCDMLMIDDLGTEPMLKNVTVEYLLLTLEERLMKKLCTLITTNYSSDQILNKYGERIYSRLSDKKHSLFMEIHGGDLRLI